MDNGIEEFFRGGPAGRSIFVVLVVYTLSDGPMVCVCKEAAEGARSMVMRRSSGEHWSTARVSMCRRHC